MRFFDKIKRYRLWDPITKQTSLENGKPRVRRRAVLWSSTSFHNANRENLARGNATSDLFLASSLSSHVTNSIIQNYPNFPLFQRLKGEEEEGYPVKWCASSPPSLSLCERWFQRERNVGSRRLIRGKYICTRHVLSAQKHRPAPRVCLCCERGTWKRPLPSNSETSNKNI